MYGLFDYYIKSNCCSENEKEKEFLGVTCDLERTHATEIKTLPVVWYLHYLHKKKGET